MTIHRTLVLAGDAAAELLGAVIDTTRADRLGAYGHDGGLTPNLDSLAARGTTWLHAHAQGPSTLMSVSSYMTGRYRLDNGMDFALHRVGDHYHPLSEQNTTVAEAMVGAGLRAEGLVANGVLRSGGRWDLNLHQGFQAWELTDDQGVVDQAIDRLAELKDEPFLLYLHLFGPHVPNVRREGFEERHGIHDTKLGDRAGPGLYQDIGSGKRSIDQGDVAYIDALYDDALAVSDSQVGQVLDALDDLGLTDNTLVILTSDHGEVLGDYRDDNLRFGHSFALIEPLLHIPLILAGPGVPAGQRVDDLVELIDLAPTLAAAQGIDIDPSWRWQGRDLLAPDPAPRTLTLADRGSRERQQTGARSPTDSAIFFHDSKSPNPYRYFDLTVPHGEETPLARKARTEDQKALRAAIEAYIGQADPPPRPRVGGGPSEQTLSRLTELGYLH